MSDHVGDHVSEAEGDQPGRGRSRARIVDVVFGGEPRATGRRIGLALGIVATLYAALGASMILLAHTTARARDLVARDRLVDLSPPTARMPTTPPPTPTRPEPAPPRARRLAAATPRTHDAAPTPANRAPAPAQAGRLAAASTEPIDLTAVTFVVGSGPGYAGGITTALGSNRAAVDGPADPAGAQAGAASAGLARPVSLDQGAWTCPWPEEADARQIDEQTVVIRARVRADGQVESVDVLSDPGSGFAQSARACALRTRFTPAHDARGRALAASSPPIRVHFFR